MRARYGARRVTRNGIAAKESRYSNVERETTHARVCDTSFVRWRRHISLTARRAAARVVLVLAPGLHLVFPDRLLAPPARPRLDPKPPRQPLSPSPDRGRPPTPSRRRAPLRRHLFPRAPPSASPPSNPPRDPSHLRRRLPRDHPRGLLRGLLRVHLLGLPRGLPSRVSLRRPRLRRPPESRAPRMRSSSAWTRRRSRRRASRRVLFGSPGRLGLRVILGR